MAHIVDGPEGTDCGRSCKCKTTPAYVSGAVGKPIPWSEQEGYEYATNTSIAASGWFPDYMNSYHVPKCKNCGYCSCCGKSDKPAE